MFCFAGLCERFTTKHVCQVLIVSCISSPDVFAHREEDETDLTAGQEAHGKQSASFGMYVNESFLDEAINCKMTHFGGRESSPCVDLWRQPGLHGPFFVAPL